MNIPDSDFSRVLIIGGGFGGINLAQSLKNTSFQVVLMDKRNYHTFQPLLYQVSTSGLEPDSIAYPLRKLLSEYKNMYYRMAEVAHIDTTLNMVRTNIGDLKYDYLVIATGTKTNFFGNESIENNAVWMKTLPQALNIRSMIFENLEKANRTEDPEKRKELMRFVIAGAGPTGVELCGAISELRANVLQKDYSDMDIDEIEIHLIEGLDRVLSPFSEKASEIAEKSLKKLDVHIHLNTMVASYENNVVTTKDGPSFKTANFIWAAGVTGAAIPGLEKSSINEKVNRYEVDSFNKVYGHENIFAIGDIAMMQSEEYPKGHPQVAQPAIQQGKHLAKNLKRAAKNEEMEPFNYFNKGTLATIGRNKGVADIWKMHFGGFLAWVLWMGVHLVFLVGFRNRLITLINWMYSYWNFDKAARLIIRPYKQNKIIAKED